MNSSTVSGVTVNSPFEPGRAPLVVVQQIRPRRWRSWLLVLVLIISVAFNLLLFSAWHAYVGIGEGVTERYHSGDLASSDKIALITVEGTIMPPFSSRTIKAIEQAGKDDEVKGVVLVVDSPGGLVADSHEIYHALRKVQTGKKKPIFVSMRRLAASGGYYIAMGAGPEGVIYAEPTTWTGSIGVLVPHYDLSKLADKVGVKEDSLKTGKYKDTMTMFRPISADDKKIWEPILDESFQQFLQVILDSRKGLDQKRLKELATGQIFTAKQAKEDKLIDEIGYLNDVIDALKKKLGLTKALVVKYESTPTFLETLMSSRGSARPASQWDALLDAAVPRAYYLFSTLPGYHDP